MNNNELTRQNTSEESAPEFVFEYIDFGTEDELEYENPLDWLDEHRRRVAQRYPTLKEQSEYYKHFSSVDDVIANVNKMITEKEQQKKCLPSQNSDTTIEKSNNEFTPQSIFEEPESEFVFEDIDFDTEDELKYEDPVDWLHEHRRRVVQRYPTLKEQSEYYKHFSSVEGVIAKVKKRIAEKEQQKKDDTVQNSNPAIPKIEKK